MVSVEHLFDLYDRANDKGNAKVKEVNTLVKLLSSYYMQSYDPEVEINGKLVSVNVLLTTNKHANTLKFIEDLLKKTWITRVNRKGITCIQNGVLYYPFDKYEFKGDVDAALREEVCRHIKALKDTLHLQALDGNPLMLLTAPVTNPELYEKVIKDAQAQGYSLNELLRITGTGITIPDVRAMYKNTGEICFTIGQVVLMYNEKTGQFERRVLELLEMGAF